MLILTWLFLDNFPDDFWTTVFGRFSGYFDVFFRLFLKFFSAIFDAFSITFCLPILGLRLGKSWPRLGLRLGESWLRLRLRFGKSWPKLGCRLGKSLRSLTSLKTIMIIALNQYIFLDLELDLPSADIDLALSTVLQWTFSETRSLSPKRLWDLQFLSAKITKNFFANILFSKI